MGQEEFRMGMACPIDDSIAKYTSRRRFRRRCKKRRSPRARVEWHTFLLIRSHTSNSMAYTQVPCRAHGMLQCPTCILQWQQQGISAVPSSSLVPSGWQSTPMSSRQSPSSLASFTPLTSGQHTPFHDSEPDEAGRSGLKLPALVPSSAQNRRQIQLRFDDLHMGASSNARAIFNYQALDTTDIGRCATISAMDTL